MSTIEQQELAAEIVADSGLARLETTQAARAWLSRLSTGFAAGADLVRFLADGHAVSGPACYFEPEPEADTLLHAWEARGVIVRGRPQPLTREQRINASDLRKPDGAYLNHFGWSPGPAFRAPPWTEPPRWPPPSPLEESLAELAALPRGTRDADGFLLVPCPGGGPLGREIHPASVRDGKGFCDVCSQRVNMREDGRVVRHLCADLLAPRKTTASS